MPLEAVLSTDGGNLITEIGSAPKNITLSVLTLTPGTDYIYTPVDPSEIALELVDPTGGVNSYSLSGGDIRRSSQGNYYYPFLSTLAGSWIGTWTTTSPAGALTFEPTVIEPNPPRAGSGGGGTGLNFPPFAWNSPVIAENAVAVAAVPWGPANGSVLVRQVRTEPSNPYSQYDFKVLRKGDFGAGLDINYAFWARNIAGIFMREWMWDFNDESGLGQVYVWISNRGPGPVAIRLLMNNRVTH